MRRRFDSSLTRVRPLFGPLLASGSSDWIRNLLASAPHADRMPQDVIAMPGEVRPELIRKRARKGGVPPLERAFEHGVPPPTAFLRYLLTHPDVLTWPLDRGERRTFGDDTTRWREALIDGPPSARTARMAAGLAELDRAGARGSRGKWWAFEGFTSVDCYIETERLVLLIEGKRTEALSTSTDWYPERNQLVRNLEAVGEIARERAAAVLLISEAPLSDIGDTDFVRSLPHLTSAGRDDVRQRYLGQTTWRALCEALDIDFATLPHERPEH